MPVHLNDKSELKSHSANMKRQKYYVCQVDLSVASTVTLWLMLSYIWIRSNKQ